MIPFATLLPVAIVLAAPGANGQQLTAGQTSRIDAMFAHLNETPSPGVSIAVVRDGGIAFSKGYGMANLEHRVPITPSSVFDIASISKQFTGLAIAILVEQGKVRLGDDITRYIPGMSGIGRTITVDNLLHHTSGLRDWPGSLSLAGWQMDDVISFDQILRFARNQRSLNFAPGLEYMYSNTGYNLLAEIVQRVTGKAFREWTDENIFQPFGMTSSRFHDDHTRMVPLRVLGYARKRDATYSSVTNNLTALGSSSLFSTAEDLGRWILNFDTKKVGGQKAVELMLTRGTLSTGATIPYAFGISHGEYRGMPTLSHSGGWAAFSTYLVHFPRQRLGVVVLGNSGLVNPTRAAFNIADVILGNAPAPVASTANSSPPAPPVDANTLASYAGLYRLGPGWYVRVRTKGSTLSTQATKEAEFPMMPRSSSEFWVEGYNAAMAFQVEPNQPVQLTYRGNRHAKLVESPPLTATQLREYAGEFESEELGTSYIVDVAGDSLVMRHRRHGNIALSRLWEDDFTGSVWFMRSVEFRRNAAGKVNGLSVLVDQRSRDIVFSRRR
jgi:CubicO group peptidase (beta-lactamase class C family)